MIGILAIDGTRKFQCITPSYSIIGIVKINVFLFMRRTFLFMTLTMFTILCINIGSTTITAIKLTACIICVIITIAVSNPIQMNTLTTYLTRIIFI